MKYKSTMVLIASLLFVGAACGQDAREILGASVLWGDAATVSMKIRLEIETQRGDKTRTIEVFIDNESEDSKLFARVITPPFLNNMKYLYIKHSAGGESKWISTSRGTRQISNAERNERLFDSDFTTDDLSKLDSDEYDVYFTEQRNAATISVRADSDRGNDRIVSIDASTNLIVRVEILDRNDSIIRLYEVHSTRNEDGIVIVDICTMRDLTTGTKTTLFVENFDTTTPIPRRIFSRASL